MNLKMAIEEGRKKTKAAFDSKVKRASKKEIVKSELFIRVFENEFINSGYGIPAAVTAKDKGMLNHLIKHLSEYLDSDDIFNLAKDIIRRWKDMAGKKFYTVEGKEMTFPTRPNLRLVLYCKNDVISFMTSNTHKDYSDDDDRRILPI